MYSKKDKENMKEYLSERFPKNSRDKFWFIASGAKREMLTFPNYYNNILNNYPNLSNNVNNDNVAPNISYINEYNPASNINDENSFNLFKLDDNNNNQQYNPNEYYNPK